MYIHNETEFEWDEAKNQANIRKHGIDFNDVPELFKHPVITSPDVREDYGEQRWISVGMLRTTVLVVVHTKRYGDVIRIISARKATRREADKYAEEIH